MNKNLLELYSDYPILFSDPETGQIKRKSEVTKNELLRSMLSTCQHNQIKYRYILADSWFSAKDNLTFIRHRLDKHFIVALVVFTNCV